LIGVKSEDAGLGRMRYQGVIRSLVVKKLEEIRTIEKKHRGIETNCID